MAIPNLELFYRELGCRINTERLRRNISQEKLSEYLGLTRASVINLEKGRHRPSVYQLIMIADYFKMDYTGLIPLPTTGHVKAFKQKKKKNSVLKNLKIVTDEEIDKSTRDLLSNFISSLSSK